MESKSHFSPDRKPDPTQLRSVSYVSEVLRHMARKADTSVDSTANLDSVNGLLADQEFMTTQYDFGVRGQLPPQVHEIQGPARLPELLATLTSIHVPIARAIVFDLYPRDTFANAVTHTTTLIDQGISTIGISRTRLIFLDKVIKGSESALERSIIKHSSARYMAGPDNPGDHAYWEREVSRYITHVGNIVGHESTFLHSLRSTYDRRAIRVAQEVIHALHTLKLSEYSHNKRSRQVLLDLLCTDLLRYDVSSVQDFIGGLKKMEGRFLIHR